MPTFVYKAMTANGQIVKNRIEDSSKVSCIKKLKRNGLIPISVTQTIKLEREVKRKNIGQKNQNRQQSQLEIYTQARDSNLLDTKKSDNQKINTVNSVIMYTQRITIKDVKIFTQNFYLLKKANFNNVHALSTVIESTENPKFRLVLEDILLGVEARRKHVCNNGILF